MRAFYFIIGSTFIIGAHAYASDSPVCNFLPQSDVPTWVNKDIRDDNFYYGVGGSAGKTANGYVEINELINQARNDAIENLSRSIRSSVKVSTKRSIESKKSSKSHAEIRKEVSQKSELVSQTALSAVMDDARWLDTKNCLLWYRVKVSKKGAEFAIQSYVNQVEERLTKRIDQLTKREIEQILSDNGFAPTTVDATRALLNNSTATYRGQEYNVADLYNQSGFNWLEEQLNETFTLRANNRIFFVGTNSLNVPMSIVASAASKKNIIRALKQLQSYGIDLNAVRVTIGKQHDKEAAFANNSHQYNLFFLAPTPLPTNIDGKTVYSTVQIETPFKTPYIYNFKANEGFEEFGLIHTVVSEQRIDLIEPLKELAVSLDVTSKHGYTPLALSIELEDFDLAKELLKQGASKKDNDYIAYKVAYLMTHINQYVTKQTAHNLPFNLDTLNSLIKELAPSKNQSKKIQKEIKTFARISNQKTIIKDGTMTKETYINGELINE